MANTLKFGNGNWATKDGSTLAYNDESGFNPLPFDFTRASSATVVNKNGLIETVASGIPRIDFLDNTKGALLLEPSRTNLIAQSEAFASTYWTKSGASIQGDPSTAGAEQVVNGNFATDSDWVKEAGWTITGGNLVATSAPSSAAYQVGSGIVSGKTYKVQFEITQYTTGSVSLRAGTSAIQSYFSTVGVHTATMVAGGALQIRFDTSGTTTLKIDNVSVKEVQGFASPSADSPLGAFKLVEDTSNGGHNIQRVENVSNATIYTSSVFVKYGGREWIRLTDAQSSNRIHFNTLTGAFGAITGTVIDYNSIALSNGWYKLSITTTSVATAYALRVSLAEADNDVSYTGDGTSGVYIFGAQLEAGSYATSLINTSGSAVTREAEKCENNLSNVVSLTEGVIFIDTTNLGNDGTNSNIISQSSSVDTVFCLKVGSNNKILMGLFASSVNIPITSTSAFPLGTRTKIAFHYKSGNTKLYINGSLEGTNNAAFTLGSGFATALRLIDTSTAYNAFPQKSIAREFKVYNNGLTDAELIALTSI